MELGKTEPMIPEREINSLGESFAKKSEKLGRCTQAFIESIQNIRAKGIAEAEVAWNAACHLNIVCHDLTALLMVMATSTDSWLRRTIARLIATIIYEGCEDLLELFGKDFVAILKSTDSWGPLEPEFRESKKRLKNFWNANETRLKIIRVTAGAHKDHDSLELLRTISEFDPEEALDWCHEFDSILNGIGAMSMNAIDAINTWYKRKGLLP